MKTPPRYTAQLIGHMDKAKWRHFLWHLKIGDEHFEYRMGEAHCTAVYKRADKGYSFYQNKKPSPESIRVRMGSHEVWAHPPSLDSVLESLFSDARGGEMSFNEFCDNYGYNNDSIEAFNIYRECGEVAKKLRRIFPGEKYAEAEEWVEEMNS